MELTALGIDLISHTYWIYYPFLHLFKFRNIVILYIDFHVSICLFIYLLFTYFYGLTSSPLPSLILGFSFVAGSTSISRPLRTWDLTCDLCLDNQLYLQKTLNLDQRTQRHRLHYNLFTAILSWGIMSLLLGLWTPTLLFEHCFFPISYRIFRIRTLLRFKTGKEFAEKIGAGTEIKTINNFLLKNIFWSQSLVAK